MVYTVDFAFYLAQVVYQDKSTLPERLVESAKFQGKQTLSRQYCTNRQKQKKLYCNVTQSIQIYFFYHKFDPWHFFFPFKTKKTPVESKYDGEFLWNKQILNIEHSNAASGPPPLAPHDGPCFSRKIKCSFPET